MNINPGKLKLIHKINHISIAILKSHHHIQAHQEIKIWIKKNINIPKAQIIQFKMAISDKFIQVNILNIYRIIIDKKIKAISTHSCNSFIIIV